MEKHSQRMKSGMGSNRNRVSRSLLLLGSSAVFLFVLVVSTGEPASSYELSVYDSYPVPLWILPIVSFACGISVVLIHATRERDYRFAITGLVVSVTAGALFLSIPIFRGYASYPKGDALTHLGMIRYTLQSGHFGSEDFYPIVHALGAYIKETADVSYGNLSVILYAAMYGLLVSNLYLIGRVLTRRKSVALAIAVLASPVVFSSLQMLIHPSIFSLFMMPLLFYFYHKSQSVVKGRPGCILILVLVAWNITFAHPVTALYAITLMIVLILMQGGKTPLSMRLASGLRNTSGRCQKYGAPLIMIAIFAMWYTSYSVSAKNLQNAIDFLLYGSGISALQEQTSHLANYSFTTREWVWLFVNRYGGLVIYLGSCTLAASALVFRAMKLKVHRGEPGVVYSTLFAVSCVLAVLSFFYYTGETNPQRLIRFPTFFVPIVLGIWLFKAGGTDSKRRHVIVAIAFLLVLTSGAINVYNSYGSARTLVPNSQITQTELAATQWLVQSADKNVTTIVTNTQLSRFVDFIYGTQGFASSWLLDNRCIPSHFGYGINSSALETFGAQERYLVVNQEDRDTWEWSDNGLPAQTPVYTPDDFNKLHSDSSVSKVFSNGGLDVYRVEGN